MDQKQQGVTEHQMRRIFEEQAASLKYSIKRTPNRYVSTKTETLWLGFQLGQFVLAHLQTQKEEKL